MASTVFLPRRLSPRWIAALILFVVCLVWGIVLTQGLPVGDPDDLDKLLAAKDLSWGTLLPNFFSPVSKSQLWSGQVNRLNEMLHVRVGHTVALKIVQTFFGFSEFPYYFFTKVLFFSATVSLVFLLLTTLAAGSVFVGLLGALAYLFVPAHYTHVLWIADTQTMVDFFVILGFFFFLHILKNLEERGSGKTFAGLLIIFFTVAWIGVKTKETALVLPIASGIYFLTRFRRWGTSKTKTVFLLVILAELVFLKVPFLSLLQGGGASDIFRFDPGIIGRLLFRNYDCGYDNEMVSAFFSTKHVWPVSIARTLGLPLLWTSIGFSLLYAIQKITKATPRELSFLAEPLTGVSVCWFFCTLPFLGMFQADPRYFSGAMIPLIFLLARLFYCVLQPLRLKHWALFLVFALFPLGSLGFYGYENIQHIFYLRYLIGKRLNYFQKTAEAIYRDMNPEKTIKPEELARFYAAINFVPQTGIAKNTYFVDLNVDHLNHLGTEKTGTVEGFGQAASKGYRYSATFVEDWPQKDSRIFLLQAVNGINSASLYEKLASHCKKKKPGKLYLYRWAQIPNAPINSPDEIHVQS